MVLLRVAAAVYFLAHLLVAAAPVVMLASGITISHMASNTHEQTLIAASNYASTLMLLQRFGEVKSLLRKTIPVARRIFGEVDSTTLRMQMGYARALFRADNAALGDILAAVETLEETTRTARRVLGSAHPLTGGIEETLRRSQAVLAFHDAAEEA